jgi:predicted metal-dependent phosphoesterase TrpH
MILKTNLHFHTGGDPEDKISYSVYEALDKAHQLGFEVVAITCHKKVAHQKEYADYALKKNILLVAGLEASIEGKDILILNCGKTAENVKTLADLRTYKKNNPQIFIMAPHPFVRSKKSLEEKLLENLDLFDAIEQTIFSNKIFNFNTRARQIAEKYGKPFVATSDTHFLGDLEHGYALIDAESKDTRAVFSAIRENKFKNKISPLGPLAMLKFKLKSLWAHLVLPILFHSKKLLKKNRPDRMKKED